MSKKKTSYLEIIDKKVDDLEKKIIELERKVEANYNDLTVRLDSLSQMLAFDITIAVTLSAFGRTRFRELDIFDNMIEEIKKKEKVFQRLKGAKLMIIDDSWYMRQIILLARAWNIPFEKLSPYLINRLGKGLAKQLILPEDLVETYGKEALEIWNLLLEKGSREG